MSQWFHATTFEAVGRIADVPGRRSMSPPLLPARSKLDTTSRSKISVHLVVLCCALSIIHILRADESSSSASMTVAGRLGLLFGIVHNPSPLF